MLYDAAFFKKNERVLLKGKIKNSKRSIKRFVIAFATVIFVFAVLLGIGYYYVSDYYLADMSVCSADADGQVLRIEGDGEICIYKEGAEVGLVFYPGGKVEYNAYIPLLRACAERGIYCVVVEMPLNLAVFDVDAALDVTKRHSDIKQWYIAGHSLGGAMAANHLSKNPEIYSGIILLGAYASDDISCSGADVLSVYGSNDGVLDREKYERYKKNLGEGYLEYVIDGGNHAYFGAYGEQAGDGDADVTRDEQIRVTADKIAMFMGLGSEDK